MGTPIEQEVFVYLHGITDDYYRSRGMNSIEWLLQRRLSRIETWAGENGFQLSETEQCVCTCQQHTLQPDPELNLWGASISAVNEGKFLDLIFDGKLTFCCISIS